MKKTPSIPLDRCPREGRIHEKMEANSWKCLTGTNTTGSFYAVMFLSWSLPTIFSHWNNNKHIFGCLGLLFYCHGTRMEFSYCGIIAPILWWTLVNISCWNLLTVPLYFLCICCIMPAVCLKLSLVKIKNHCIVKTEMRVTLGLNGSWFSLYLGFGVPGLVYG